MQEIAVTAEIHFHEQDVVSIFHETNVGGSEEKFAELSFAAGFAIRIMSNLGTHELTDALAQQLQLVGQIIAQPIEQLLNMQPRVIRYPGHPGRKQFNISLRMTDQSFKFGYSDKGFGFLSKGLGYYGPAAVQSVFRYFASRRSNDDIYLNALANCAIASGQFQLGRKITLTNHAQLEMALMRYCLVELLPIPYWHLLKGVPNDEYTLRRKALVYSPLVVEDAVGFFDLARTPVPVDFAIPQTIENKLEYLTAHMHVIDRMAFYQLGGDKRNWFIDPFFERTMDEAMTTLTGTDEPSEGTAVRTWFSSHFEARTEEYSKYAFPPEKNDKGGVDISNSLGFNVSKNLGFERDDAIRLLVGMAFDKWVFESLKKTNFKNFLLGT
jgi:hypothetical protein